MELNKLMFFPMCFMFMLTIYAVADVGGTFAGESANYTSDDELTIDYTTGSESGSVDIPGSGSHEFDIWAASTAMIILVVAMAVGILGGIKILGSGLSEMSQKMIFNGILFLGLWAGLTLVSIDFFFDYTVLTLLWVSLTTVYVLGVGVHMSGTAESA